MVLKDSTSATMLAYAFRNGALVNLPAQQNFASTGSDWTVLGFGNFSSQFPLGMITRYSGTNPTLQNEFLIYDIVQTFDQNNTPIYTAVLSNVDAGFGPGVLIAPNTVGSNAVLAGFAPISTTVERLPADMVLRDTNTGKFYVYDIRNDAVTFSGELPQLSTSPIPANWTVGGIAPDLSATTGSGSTSQLVQAMAGFGGSGAADGLNPVPVGADTSQQQFLATPQHA
jgi:hypothetical protein